MAESTRSNYIERFKACILLGFCYMLCFLVFSGQIKNYINPRFTWLTMFAIFVIFSMAMVQTKIIFSYSSEEHHHDHYEHHSLSIWALVPFIIPLVFACVLPNATLSADLAAKRGMNISAQSTAAASPTPGLVNNQTSSFQSNGAEKNHDYSLDNTLNVNDSNFMSLISQIYSTPKKFDGKEITMVGFISRDSDFSKIQFGLVRYVIVCCTADAMPGGLLCEYARGSSYKDGTWLQIRGTLGMDKLRGMDVAVVKVSSAQPVNPPDSPYVYPSN